MTDYGATLNARAGAQHEEMFERSVVIDQLTEIFVATGLEIGGTWFNRADAVIYLHDSDEFCDWQDRCMNCEASDKPALMAEYDRMLLECDRVYVSEVLEPMIDEEMKEATGE